MSKLWEPPRLRFPGLGLVVLIVLGFWFPGFGQNPGITNDTLKVLTFNVFGMPESNWATRQTMILAEVAESLPDLIALQEVIEPGGTLDVRAKVLADSLLHRTGVKYDFVYQRTHFSWNRWFEGIAILSRHIILDSEALSLPPGLFPRAVIWCRLLTPAGIVNLFDTHLSFGNQEPVRQAQVEAIRAFVTEKSADGVAVANIVCGDFNAIPDSPPVQQMTNPDSGAAFVDTWAVANPGEPGFTIPSDRPDARIDYVFVREDGAFQVLGSELAFTKPNADDLFPSDHIGVLSSIATTNHKLNVNIQTPLPGAAVAGETTITWSIDSQIEPVSFKLYISNDAGRTWREEWSGESADNSYSWNTVTQADGTRYTIRIAAIGDSSFGVGQSDSTFTVNNPGNAAPELEIESPRGGELLRGIHVIKWSAADADGDPLTIALDLSSDAGMSWQELAANEANDGTFMWDTQQFANSPSYRLRLRTSDGSSEVAVESDVFAVQNVRPDFPASQFAHVAGAGDGIVRGSIIDSTLLTGHAYRITFDDTLFAHTTYAVRDMAIDSFVVQQAAQLDGVTEGPAFDGLRLIVFDFPVAEVNADSTGWTKGASTMEYTISTPTVIIDSQEVESVPSASDYRITLFDTVVDSTSAAFGFAAKPIKFLVWNVTEGRKADVLFSEFDNNQTISDLDKVTILAPNDQGDLQLSWAIFFQGQSNTIPPAPGDEFTLTTLKPFTSEDVFQFSGVLPTAVAGQNKHEIPESLTLFPNYPNPFNPETTITFDMPRAGKVRLAVFNVLGQEVARLIDGARTAGRHSIKWNAANTQGAAVASGLYFYQIVTNRQSLVRKMLLIR